MHSFPLTGCENETKKTKAYLFSSAARSLASRRCPRSSSGDEDREGLRTFGLALLDKFS